MNESSTTPEFIYHLVTKFEFQTQVRDNAYIPVRYSEDGFIHCTGGEDLTILVANDYFSKEPDVLVLKISLKKLMAKVVFEKPAPISGGGNSHLIQKTFFPHIYGALNLDSIDGIAKMPRINYVFHFPKEFYSYTQFKEGRL